MQYARHWFLGAVLSVVAWVSPVSASSEQSLSDYMNCVEVFTETDTDLMRVTTLFCGDDQNLIDDLEARQYVFAYVSKTSRAVDYQIQLMIRSESPLEPRTLVADGHSRPLHFRTSTRECLPDVPCGYETAISFSVKGLLIDGFLDTLIADGEREWSYEVELANGDVLPFVFQADELRAVHYLTQGLLVAVPAMDHDDTTITGI